MCLDLSVDLKLDKELTVYKVMRMVRDMDTVVLIKKKLGIKSEIHFAPPFYGSFEGHRIGEKLCDRVYGTIVNLRHKEYRPGFHCFLTKEDAERYMKMLSETKSNLCITACKADIRNLTGFGTTTIFSGGDVQQELLTLIFSSIILEDKVS